MSATTELRPRASAQPTRRALARIRASGTARAAAAHAALLGLAATGVVFALGATGAPSFFVPGSPEEETPGWMAGPLEPLAVDLGVVLPIVLFALMIGCYAALVASSRSLSGRAVAACIVGLHAVFLLAPPLLSSDVFGYIAFARLESVHDLSPYLNAVEAIPDDPINDYLSSVWPTGVSTPYGPLFVIATVLVAPLGIAASLWTLKLLTAVAALAAVAAVASAARAAGRDPLPPALIIGLNPLWLVWAVGGAHNDVLMALGLAGAIQLLWAGRAPLGGAALVAGASVKATAGLALPFLLAGSARRKPLATGVVLATAAGAIVSLAAMGTDVLAYPGALIEQARDHVSNHNIPEQVGELLGVGGLTDRVQLVAQVAFGAALAGLLLYAWRRRDPISAAGWAIAAMLVLSTSLHPWYIAALLPLAALSESRALRVVTVILTVVLAAVRLTPT